MGRNAKKKEPPPPPPRGGSSLPRSGRISPPALWERNTLPYPVAPPSSAVPSPERSTYVPPPPPPPPPPAPTTAVDRNQDPEAPKDPAEDSIARGSMVKNNNNQPGGQQQTKQGSPSRRRCGQCVRGTVSFLVSSIGLTCLMVGYAVFGGFIFKKLEAPNEKILKNNVAQSRTWHVQRLWNLTYELNILYQDNWTKIADEIMENYTKLVYSATKNGGWDGKDGESELQWTFAGALLYSITVITTIGYGHIAPRTTWGRLVTIIYALFGIPLTLLTIANLGGFMATAFRFLYKNICCGLCCICCIPCRTRRTPPNVRSAAVRYRDPQNGDVGATRALTSDGTPTGDTIDSPHQGPAGTPGSDGVPPGGQTVATSPAPPKRSNVRVVWSRGLRRMFRTEDNKRVSVPITVSVLVLSSYILSGAVLFTVWEDDWDYLIGSYFCFITLTTIGFGDFVPGTSQDSWANQEKLVLCALYLLIGLALIAMCFDLMQEEARNMVRALGVKLGIVEKDKPDKNKPELAQ